jgi:hypothetical protein
LKFIHWHTAFSKPQVTSLLKSETAASTHFGSHPEVLFSSFPESPMMIMEAEWQLQGHNFNLLICHEEGCGHILEDLAHHLKWRVAVLPLTSSPNFC